MKNLPTLAAAVPLVLGLVLAAALTAAAPARADQNDDRLQGLFVQLLEAPGPAEAQSIEGMIWSIWVQSDDGAVRALMQDGNKRATVHYLLGNYALSLADIAKTLELEPRHFGALSGRGLVYIALRDEARALKAFDAALAIHPNLVSAAINAAQLRKILRERDI